MLNLEHCPPIWHYRTWIRTNLRTVFQERCAAGVVHLGLGGPQPQVDIHVFGRGVLREFFSMKEYTVGCLPYDKFVDSEIQVVIDDTL